MAKAIKPKPTAPTAQANCDHAITINLTREAAFHFYHGEQLTPIKLMCENCGAAIAVTIQDPE